MRCATSIRARLRAPIAVRGLSVLVTLLAVFGPLATGGAFASVSSVYWTTGSETLYRAKSHGSDREELLASEFGLATGMAINQRDHQLYWVEALPISRIRRSPLDGSGAEDLIQLLDNPAGIDLDLTSNKMYWTERYSNQIRRANLDGSAIETVVENTVEPRGLRVDPVHGHLYWVEYGTNRLRRANLDGTGVVDLISTGMSRPWDLEIDIANQKIYWSQLGPEFNNTLGAILRSDLSGAMPELLADKIGQPGSINLDAASGHLWFTHGFVGKIERINLTDRSVETMFSTGNELPQYLVIEIIPEPATVCLILAAWIAGIAFRRRQ